MKTLLSHGIWPLLLVLPLLFVAGCAHQGYGQSEYTLNQDGTFVVKSGKETGQVEAVMSRDGDKQFVYFNAIDVRAFEGQRIGAEVSANITNAVRELLPEMLSQAVRAALGTKAIEGAGALLAPMPPGVAVPPAGQ